MLNKDQNTKEKMLKECKIQSVVLLMRVPRLLSSAKHFMKFTQMQRLDCDSTLLT